MTLQTEYILIKGDEIRTSHRNASKQNNLYVAGLHFRYAHSHENKLCGWPSLATRNFETPLEFV